MRRRLVNRCVEKSPGVLHQGGKSRDLLSEIDRLDAQPYFGRVCRRIMATGPWHRPCPQRARAPRRQVHTKRRAARGCAPAQTSAPAGPARSPSPRLLSVECAVQPTDRQSDFAYPLSVCPCSRHTRFEPERALRRERTPSMESTVHRGTRYGITQGLTSDRTVRGSCGRV